MYRLPLWSRILIILALAIFTFFNMGSTADFAVILLLFIPWLIISIIGFQANDTPLEICTALMILSTIAYQDEYLSDMGQGLLIASALIAIWTMIFNAFFFELCDPDGPYLFWYDMLCIASIAICCICAYIKGPFVYIDYARIYGTIPCVVLYAIKTRIIDMWGSSGSSGRSDMRDSGSFSKGFAPQYVVDDAISSAQSEHRLVTVIRTEYHPTHVVVYISIPAGYYQMPSEFANTIHSRISDEGYSFGVEIKSKYD